ncbi:tetratricopeptide repeat protein [Moheibacter sediminis]|uniref:tetratricopeptide repeat protein n=1 Tax=Moheibacter sediminis TaxID=1434700 RepID=UPI00135664A9|nr:LuxR C-terminal-related transcriptional regulator [Moheibacter sediminis]
MKSKIEVLYKNQDILAINKMIHEDNSLEPEYVFEKLNRNIEISLKNNNDKDLADTYIVLGNFWHQQANKLKAFENYLQAETISRRINEKKLLATALMNKSTLLDDKQEKIQTLQEASEIFSEKKDTVNLIKSYLNTGVIYSQLYEEADDSVYRLSQINNFKKLGFEFYSKAEKLNQKIGNKELEGVLFIYYGEWYKHERQFDKAIESFQKAQKVLTETKHTKAQTYCFLMLAKIAFEMKEFNQTHTLLKQAEQLAEKYKFNDYLVRIYDEYVKLYTEQNDLNKALLYSKLYADKSIELAEQSNDNKMQILSLEKNIAENQLQLNEYESDSKMNRFLLIVSFLIAVFIGGISYLIIKNNRRKIDSIEQNKIITELEKSAIEIELKNQLLEEELLKEKVKYSQNNLITFANQVTKIDTFLDDLKTEMKGNLTTVEKQEKINDLKISFAEVLNNQNELKQINSLSSELNQEFFFHIRKNYPAITKEDEQLLSYLILNLSNKEISKKLNISIKSLYTKRYRLRKKLNLEENEKLLDFYKKVVDEFVA